MSSVPTQSHLHDVSVELDVLRGGDEAHTNAGEEQSPLNLRDFVEIARIRNNIVKYKILKYTVFYDIYVKYTIFYAGGRSPGLSSAWS